MLVLAFDTATEVATVALVRDGELLGERLTTAGRLLVAVEELTVGVPDTVERIVVGVGPGRYTSLRMGLVSARALAYSLGATVAGVSTLEALAAGAGGALPVVDARRQEVFTLADGPAVLRPEALALDPGVLCVGDGAVRYRDVLEAGGAVVPPDGDPRHVPWARHHAGLATTFGPSELVEPVYLRAPDADRAIARRQDAGGAEEPRGREAGGRRPPGR